MRLSDKGKIALAKHEGIVPGPYLDSVGVWTFGIGHTAAAGAPDPAEVARGMPNDLDGALKKVMDLFARDVAKYEAAVLSAVKVPLRQHEFDALVSFHYNTGGIHRASVTRYLNAGNRERAAAAFMNWSKPPEIIPRRKEERRLFETGQYPTGNINVWSVSSSGRIDWGRPARTLRPDEFLAIMRPTTSPRPAARPSWFTRFFGGKS